MENNKKKVYIFISIIIILLVGILVYFLFINRSDKTNLVDNKDLKYETTSEKTNIIDNKDLKYEIRHDNLNNKSFLYINDKLFNDLDWDMYEQDDIYKIDDILVVSVCTSGCQTYFVDKNAKIIGSIGDSNTKRIINPRFENYVINKVENNDIYIESFDFLYEDGSSLCDFKDKEIVKVEEKYTYIGNGKFTEGTLISSYTAKEILETDQRFSCDK